MFILGLQGSPRKRGNTHKLLSMFLNEAERLGARTHMMDVPEMKIQPCLGCGNCEKKGFCIIKDNMQDVYRLLRRADVIVMGTPVYFYGATAQLKALIDRSQALWSRKYVFHLDDPLRKWRRGYFLSVGATKGKDLFEGITLTAKYFFDAVGARYEGSLTYWKIEVVDDIEKHATALSDAAEEAGKVVQPFLNRKRILFICKENACRSQMAAAFSLYHFGDKVAAISAGSMPADAINPMVITAMGEKGIDMAYHVPRSIDDALQFGKPDMIVTMGCGEACPVVPGARHMEWDLPDPAERSIDFMREIRDEIENRIKSLITSELSID